MSMNVFSKYDHIEIALHVHTSLSKYMFWKDSDIETYALSFCISCMSQYETL